jgi:cytosine/adenosine deaminase-related metal-dependent hydrolase
MADLLITHGILLTMDPERRIIEDGAVAVEGGRIIAVGANDEIVAAHYAPREIDARRKVVMPGLIDGHAHAGHALVKSLGTDHLDAWNDACYRIYQNGSDEEFWYAEAQLSALERLKCGTTTSVNLFGGGEMVMRTDDPIYGGQHCQAVQQVGIREFLAVGPGRPPFPRSYTRWSGEERHDSLISFEKQMEVSEALIQDWHQKGNGRISICVVFPTARAGLDTYDTAELADLKRMAREARQLSRKYDVVFTQDGHSRGTIRFAHDELGLLGPDAVLAHNINLTAEEIDICRRTDTKIVHNPSSIMSILGRCPVPELLDAGVTVFLGSDGVAPDRSYDMFRHMFQCMRYHRTYYRDVSYMPPGKVLEMVTIDAARGLGLEAEIGSLEMGKKADIILVDLYKPHLYPLNMPAYRIAYFASGSDVDTVIIDGEILMENRIVKSVNEGEVLDLAQSATEKALERTGLHHLMELPDHFWGHSRF